MSCKRRRRGISRPTLHFCHDMERLQGWLFAPSEVNHVANMKWIYRLKVLASTVASKRVMGHRVGGC